MIDSFPSYHKEYEQYTAGFPASVADIRSLHQHIAQLESRVLQEIGRVQIALSKLESKGQHND